MYPAVKWTWRMRLSSLKKITTVQIIKEWFSIIQLIFFGFVIHPQLDVVISNCWLTFQQSSYRSNLVSTVKCSFCPEVAEKLLSPRHKDICGLISLDNKTSEVTCDHTGDLGHEALDRSDGHTLRLVLDVSDNVFNLQAGTTQEDRGTNKAEEDS